MFDSSLPVPLLWLAAGAVAALLAGLGLGLGIGELRRVRLQQPLQQRLAALETERALREQYHAQQLEELAANRKQLRREFEHLSQRIFEDRGRSFSEHNRAAVDAMLRPLREQLARFESRVNAVHNASERGNAALSEQLQQVRELGLSMNEQAASLARALRGDSKALGNWGEAQLERTLELAGLKRDQHYQLQRSFSGSEGQRLLPDCIIQLPGERQLVIDSKVSLADYQTLVNARDEAARAQALKAHLQAVRRHIDELAAKDYSQLPGLNSPDFVIMFMPVEAAWLELLRSSPETFDYGQSRNIVLVSHTTLMPVLRTVDSLWRIERGNREAQAVAASAGELFNAVCTLSERVEALGRSLGASTNHYNRLVGALAGQQGLQRRVESFKALSGRASKQLQAAAPVQQAPDYHRLQATPPAPSDGAGTVDES